MRDWNLAASLEGLPAVVNLVLAALTALGDPLVVLTVAILLYWVGPRLLDLEAATGARLAVAALIALAAVPGAKAALAMPRPPVELRAIAADGYGVPSGHATAAATLAIALALLTNWGDRRRRWLAAGGFVALVSFTRVALGAHYLGDVLAGAALGTICAGVAVEVTRRRIRPGVLLALAVGVGGVLLGGLEPGAPMTQDIAIALGGTVGAATTWVALDAVGADFTSPSVAVLVGGAVLAASGAWLALGLGGVPLAIVGGALAGATATAVPRIEAIPSGGLRRSPGSDRPPTR